MLDFTLRQPVEVISYQGVTHYVSGGFCLQCEETETYLTENGGVLLGTINSGGQGTLELSVEEHDSK